MELCQGNLQHPCRGRREAGETGGGRGPGPSGPRHTLHTGRGGTGQFYFSSILTNYISANLVNL